MGRPGGCRGGPGEKWRLRVRWWQRKGRGGVGVGMFEWWHPQDQRLAEVQEGPVGFWQGFPGEWWRHLRAGQATQDRRNRSGRGKGCLVLDVLSLR